MVAPWFRCASARSSALWFALALGMAWEGTAGGGSDSSLSPSVATHRGFLCTRCHDGHGETQNLHGVPELMETPASGPRPVVFLSEIGAHSFADGDLALDGVCEVCHTTTLYHRNDASGDHTHFASSRCVVCHPHDTGFLPAAVAGVTPPAEPGLRLRLGPSPTRGPITARVSARSEGARAAILDPTGRTLAVLAPPVRTGDEDVFRWDGRDGGGRPAAAGVYFLLVESEGRRETRRFLVLR